MTVFQRLYKNLLVAIITLAVITTNLSARWNECNKCDLEVILYKSNIKVNADGSSEEIVEYRIKALNDSGRGYLNALLIRYDKALMDIDILAACTITKGSKYIVDLISTPAISNPSINFKDKYEIPINFPKVEIGSEVQLSLKYRKKVVFSNHYYSVENYNYNEELYQVRNLASSCGHYHATIKHAHFKITSEIPLYVKINDPHNVLSIKTDAKSEQGSFNVAEITLNKPLATLTVDEPRFNEIMPDEYLTWVSVSSFNKWEDFSTGYDYFAVLAQKMPQLFADIAQKAKNYTDEDKQIGFVMSAIIDKVEYKKSNKPAIRELFVPRDLQEIASTQMGSCMELSISTGAILQQLGYKVYPAVVYRGSIYKAKPYLLSPYHFNHAIIKVVGKTGKVYWLDPTGAVISVNRPLPDIASKMALVFTGNQTASYEYIPEVDYNHAKITEEVVLVKYDDDNNIASLQCKSTYEGEKSSKIIPELLLPVPNQLFSNYDNHLFSVITMNLFLGDKIQNKHVALLTEVKSRFLQDIAIKCEFDMSGSGYYNHVIYNSNLGRIFVMFFRELLINPILSVISDQVSDIILCDYPYTLIRKFVIKGQKIKNVSDLNSKMNTKWVDIERRCQYVDDDTEIITTVKFYKRIIRSADLKTQEYKMLLKKVKDMLLNAAVVLE